MLIIALLVLSSHPADIKKALEYQYETQIEALKMELEKTQAELHKARQAQLNCSSSNSSSAPETKAQIQRRTKKEIKTLYQNALRLMANEKWQDALIALESFVHIHPNSDLADNAIYLMAEIYFTQGERQLARSELERLIQQYPKSDRRIESLSKLRRIDDGQN